MISLPDRLLNNPITVLEKQQATQPRSRTERLAMLFAIPTAFWLIGILVWLAWRNPPWQFIRLDIVLDWLQTPITLLVVYGILLHVQTVGKTLSLGVHAVITRTHTGAWESLVMTGIDARRLVYGRWWAVVQLTWRRFLLLGIIRAAAILGLGMVLINNGSRAFVYVSEGPSVSPTLDALLAVVAIVTLTVVNGMFTAAAGVLGSFFARAESPGLFTAIAARIGALLLPLLLILLPVFMFILRDMDNNIFEQDTPIFLVLETFGMTLATLVDNGVLLGMTQSNPLDQGTKMFIVVLLLAVGIYWGLLWGMLWVAQIIARRQGVAR